MRAVPFETSRRWLWIAALITMPVPFYLGEVEWAPVLRLAFLTGLFGAVWLAEPEAKLGSLMGMGLVQTAAYVALFRLAAGLAARAFGRIDSPPIRIAAVGTAVFLLFVSGLLPIYETPLSSARMRSSLWQLFD